MASKNSPAFVEPAASDEDFVLPVIDLGRSEIKVMQANKLEVDPKLQRGHLDERKVTRIRDGYNTEALGIITVSHRNAVSDIILDGWHRQRATIEKFDGGGELLCRVFTGLSAKEEAILFLLLNSGSQPNLLDKFRINLVAEDEIAVGIDNIVKTFGLAIGPSTSEGNIQCVGALRKVYMTSIKGDYDPNLLDLTVRAITGAWGKNRQGLQAVIVEGIALFLAKNGQKLDYERTIHRLRDFPGGADGLHNRARTNAGSRGMRMPHSVADLVTDHYNKGLGARKLPVWVGR